MPDSEQKQLREEFLTWIHFVLHDKDFQEAMRSKYTQADIDAAITAIEQWLQNWIQTA